MLTYMFELAVCKYLTHTTIGVTTVLSARC